MSSKSERENRINAVQVIMASAIIASNHHPDKRDMILDKTMAAMHILGASEQEILSGVITADFIKLPPEIVEQLVRL